MPFLVLLLNYSISISTLAVSETAFGQNSIKINLKVFLSKTTSNAFFFKDFSDNC